MEPRSIERGNDNDAAASTIAFTASMEPRSIERGNYHQRIGYILRINFASMEPRSIERGNQSEAR